jgi:hypothetical protein
LFSDPRNLAYGHLSAVSQATLGHDGHLTAL